MFDSKHDKLFREQAPEIDAHPNPTTLNKKERVCYLWKHQSYIHVYGTITNAYSDYKNTCKMFKVEPVDLWEFQRHLNAPYGQLKHWTGERLKEPHDTHFNCIVITTKKIF